MHNLKLSFILLLLFGCKADNDYIAGSREWADKHYPGKEAIITCSSSCGDVFCDITVDGDTIPLTCWKSKCHLSGQGKYGRQ